MTEIYESQLLLIRIFIFIHFFICFIEGIPGSVQFTVGTSSHTQTNANTQITL